MGAQAEDRDPLPGSPASPFSSYRWLLLRWVQSDPEPDRILKGLVYALERRMILPTCPSLGDRCHGRLVAENPV
jgi:hypothetical protein